MTIKKCAALLNISLKLSLKYSLKLSLSLSLTLLSLVVVAQSDSAGYTKAETVSDNINTVLVEREKPADVRNIDTSKSLAAHKQVSDTPLVNTPLANTEGTNTHAIATNEKGELEGGADVKTDITTNINTDVKVDDKPQVGRHVMANMNAGSMIISLLMVLVLIILCAFVLKRFNLTTQGVSQLNIISSLSLGAKERVIVVQVGEQQLLLGVTSQHITLLDKLEEPIVSQGVKTSDLPKSVLAFLTPQAKKLST